MADIELLIKIPEEIYKASQIIDAKYEDVVQIPLEVIVNGTPLPKGHGRLIDADKYRKDMQESREFNFFATLDFQQTIIEANEAETENKE